MSETFPPSDYVQTESAIKGIDIYMPKPPEEEHRPVVAFSCPQCGGHTAYINLGEREVDGLRAIRWQEISMIEVQTVSEGDPLEFEVIVREGSGETHHHVTMSQDTWHRLTSRSQDPKECISASFRFLLDREPRFSHSFSLQ